MPLDPMSLSLYCAYKAWRFYKRGKKIAKTGEVRGGDVAYIFAQVIPGLGELGDALDVVADGVDAVSQLSDVADVVGDISGCVDDATQFFDVDICEVKDDIGVSGILKDRVDGTALLGAGARVVGRRRVGAGDAFGAFTAFANPEFLIGADDIAEEMLGEDAQRVIEEHAKLHAECIKEAADSYAPSHSGALDVAKVNEQIEGFSTSVFDDGADEEYLYGKLADKMEDETKEEMFQVGDRVVTSGLKQHKMNFKKGVVLPNDSTAIRKLLKNEVLILFDNEDLGVQVINTSNLMKQNNKKKPIFKRKVLSSIPNNFQNRAPGTCRNINTAVHKSSHYPKSSKKPYQANLVKDTTRNASSVPRKKYGKPLPVESMPGKRLPVKPMPAKRLPARPQLSHKRKICKLIGCSQPVLSGYKFCRRVHGRQYEYIYGNNWNKDDVGLSTSRFWQYRLTPEERKRVRTFGDGNLWEDMSFRDSDKLSMCLREEKFSFQHKSKNGQTYRFNLVEMSQTSAIGTTRRIRPPTHAFQKLATTQTKPSQGSFVGRNRRSSAARGWFNAVDADGNGALSKLELSNILMALSPSSSKTVKTFINNNWPRWDLDGNGAISLKEFICNDGLKDDIEFLFLQRNAPTQRCPPFQHEHMRQWFNFCDEDEKGYINCQQMIRGVINTRSYNSAEFDDLAKREVLVQVLRRLWDIFGDDYGLSFYEFTKTDGLADTLIVTLKMVESETA